jgi:DNA-binding transcriptional ArsR family regulator/uncharacterized protein YndB with AHSA1/START domain
MDEVFRALADPSRRRLLDTLNERNGQTLRELCAGLAMARQSVSKHLAVLEGAGLVVTRRHGREKLHFLNPAPITEISERWIHHYDRQRLDALADLKNALEDHAMDKRTDKPTDQPTDKPEFVYTTYIRTTPEQLWQALTTPAFTERYWGVTLESEWTKGSEVVWHQQGVAIRHPEQVVLEADPFRRLAYTWHTFTPEWAAAWKMDPALAETWSRERRSSVSFELDEEAPLVKLTVVHGDFDPGSEVLEGVRGGWPRILSALKTLLETGEV